MHKSDAHARFVALLKGLDDRRRLSVRIHDFLEATCARERWAFRMPDAEAEYERLRQKHEAAGLASDFVTYPKMREALYDAMDDDISRGGTGDILGPLFMQAGLGASEFGQFFSPPDVCKLSVALTMREDDVRKTIRDKGFVGVMEPTAGSGGMILAMAALMESWGISPGTYMPVVACELDPVVAMICYLQLSVAGIAATVICGNTLTQKELWSWPTPGAILISMNAGRHPPEASQAA